MNFKRLISAMSLVAAALLSASHARAAITATGGITPAVNPSLWNSSTYAYVGYGGDGTLTIDGGSTLATYAAEIGQGYKGTATVSGAGSKWTVSSNFNVGDMGTGILNITNGGSVSAGGTIYIPNSNPGGVGTATVDGAGSTLTGGTIYVGIGGSNPGTLNITNGATVTSSGLTQVSGLGSVNFGSSNGGTLNTGYIMTGASNISGAGTINTSGIVTDADIAFNASTGGAATSFLLNGATVNLNQSDSQYLGVGYSGTGTLSISGGVQVTSGFGYLGYNVGSTGTATVDGAGSKWTSSNLMIGSSGTGTLNIINGGAVSSKNVNIASGNNSVGTLNIDGGSLTTNGLYIGRSGTGIGALNLANGGTVSVTGTTTVGTLSKIDFGNGGTLTTDTLLAGATQLSGTGTINTSGIITDANLAFNASTGSALNFQVNGVNVNLNQISSNYLGVGYTGTGTMSITGGVQVASYDSYLGYNAGSNGTATVDGAGSTWTSRYLDVGESGTGTLNVVNGGNATLNSLMLGYNAGSSGTLSVDGAGSTVTSSGGISVGSSGNGAVTVTNGGTITNSYVSLGYNKGASGTVTVDGTGSKWINNSDLNVGYSGTGVLNVTNGAVFSSTGKAYLGYSAGSSGTVSVDGAGSTWSNGGNVYVGNNSSSTGTLNITNGGSASGAALYIGSAGSGIVTVDGEGSTLTGAGTLTIGSSGTAGTLNITNGGAVSVAGATTVGTLGKIDFGTNGGTLTTSSLSASPSQLLGVGIVNTGGIIADGNLVFNASTGNTTQFKQSDVTVNLTPISSSKLGVGYLGSGSLSISDGIQIASSTSYIGYGAGSSGTATVDGAGSKWSASSLYVGYDGTAGAVLNISNGGEVAVTGSTTVKDLGSIHFSNGGTLTTGMLNASGAQLSGVGTINTTGIIADGDIVYNASTGAGTTQFQENGITINLTQKSSNNFGAGNSGSGSLTIKDGVQIASGKSYLGYGTGSTGTGTVDGEGSKWTTTTLYVGNNGTGTLNVTNGGAVTASSDLLVGNSDGTAAGTLNLANGGTVTVTKTTTVEALGKINFGSSNGGTLTTGMLYAGSSQLSGAGTINTSGIVTDGNLAFNATHGTNQSFTMNGVTVNLNQSSTKDLGIGYIGSGSMTISEGVGITSSAGYLGYMAGSTGVATIDGTNSKWMASGNFNAGYNGNGTLNIINGGSCNVSGTTNIGGQAGSTGTITVDGAGSYLGNKSFYIGASGNGNFNIINGGNVITGSLIYIGASTGSTGNAVVSGAGSRWTSSTDIHAGSYGTGSLLINNGGRVNTRSSYVGYGSGGQGILTIDGADSTLSASSTTVGVNGTGRMFVTNGGNVTTANAWIGSNSTQGGTGTGAATVDGTGSTWTNTGKSFSLGEKVANNKLSISDGGAVTSGGFAIYDGSMLTVDIGKRSSLAVSGTLTNNGTMRLVAGAAAANGTYTPISAETWEGTTGIVQALGGIWDAANHTVTVSDAELALAGRTKTIDTSVTQRLLVIDAATAQIAGASFLGTETSSTISFSASLLGNDERYLLESTADADQQYLGGWEFTADGYTDGDPIYLSLGVGSGYSLGDLNVWHFDGTSWNMLDAADLAYDNTYASFTVNDLSSYAVTGSAPVPIPAAAWLLGSGLMGLFGLRRRMQT